MNAIRLTLTLTAATFVTLPVVHACELRENTSGAVAYTKFLEPAVEHRDSAQSCYYLGVLRNFVRYLEGATRAEQSSDPSCSAVVTNEIRALSAEIFNLHAEASTFCAPYFGFLRNPVQTGDWNGLTQRHVQLRPKVEALWSKVMLLVEP